MQQPPEPGGPVPPPEFSMILASATHDIKNSLSLVLESIDQVRHQFGDGNPQLGKALDTLQYEAARVNNDLVYLLGLYRLRQRQLAANIDEHYLEEFLEEQAARHQQLADSRGVQLSVEADTDLNGYFDHDLIAGVMGNVVVNALRYTRDHIRLSAEPQASGVRISVEDNGEGFPPALLKDPLSQLDQWRLLSGNTALGLYFASEVARLHRSGEQQGRIELSNGGSLGGGVFYLYLP